MLRVSLIALFSCLLLLGANAWALPPGPGEEEPPVQGTGGAPNPDFVSKPTPILSVEEALEVLLSRAEIFADIAERRVGNCRALREEMSESLVLNNFAELLAANTALEERYSINEDLALRFDEAEARFKGAAADCEEAKTIFNDILIPFL